MGHWSPSHCDYQSNYRREEAVAAGQGTSKAKKHCERTAKERKTKAKRAKGNPSRPALVSRKCLPNSSQEDGKSETQSESLGTRKSKRRHKPVDKVGRMMIDSITKEKPRGVKKL